MISKAELRSTFLKKALLSNYVWLPVALGGATMALATGIPFWIGAGAVGVGIGSAIWRFTFGRRATEELVIQQLREEANRQHYAYLRSLQRKLRRDRDPLTGKQLRQLRAIHKRMVDLNIFSVATDAPSWQVEIRQQMAKLYESSVGSLERSCDIWKSSQQVHDKELQNELSRKRSHVLTEVTQSIERLGKTLDQMQVSSMKSEQPESELTSLRQELEQGLDVARNIEVRIDELNQQVRQATQPARES